MKDKNIDLVAAFKFFFDLPDWKTRVLMFAAPILIGIVLYVLMIIPLIGCLFMIFFSVFSLAMSLYMSGAMIAQARSIKVNKGAIEIYADFGSRLVDGLKVVILVIYYNVPAVLLVLVGYAILFVGLFLGIPLSGSSSVNLRYADTAIRTAPNPGAILALLLPIVGFYVLVFIAYVLIIFVNLFLFPVVVKKVINNSSYSEAFNIVKTVKQFKKDFWHILVIASGEMGSAVVFIMPYMFSFALIFLCVGIILVPLLLVTFAAYHFHLRSHLYGQYAAIPD